MFSDRTECEHGEVGEGPHDDDGAEQQTGERVIDAVGSVPSDGAAWRFGAMEPARASIGMRAPNRPASMATDPTTL